MPLLPLTTYLGVGRDGDERSSKRHTDAIKMTAASVPIMSRFWDVSSTLAPPGAGLFALSRWTRRDFKGAIMGLLDDKAFFRPGVPPPAPRRLDGRSKVLLSASLKTLPEEEPGWITMKEAKTLFSQEDDAYAFGEMDEAGKADLAAFASESGNVQFEFMPVQGRLYFMREASR